MACRSVSRDFHPTHPPLSLSLPLPPPPPAPTPGGPSFSEPFVVVLPQGRLTMTPVFWFMLHGLNDERGGGNKILKNEERKSEELYAECGRSHASQLQC